MNINKIRYIFENTNNSQKEIPIWLMRQAGRYLPEYRAVRENFKNFMDFCYNPESAALVTLQPIKRFNFDAAIIFSDILVIPDSLGQEVNFIEAKGPILQEFSSAFIENPTNLNKLKFVYEAIELTRSKLDKTKSLIGFSGAPFTLACYMTKAHSKDFESTKQFLYGNFDLFKSLIDRLTVEVKSHLSNQIEAGCDIIKVFDSWSGLLHGEFYEEFVIKPNKEIIKFIKETYPKVYTICFPRNSSLNYSKFAHNVKPHCLAIDQNIDRTWINENINQEIAIQGNLDPLLLTTTSPFLETEINDILTSFKKRKFIFNLGHGITPQARIDQVEKMIKLVKSPKS
ncbi:uroporphyrinogen decarboxylase [Rickettsiales endosymbiont of Stachyamoeba lipophora]|uniref:uroporphyrinogen decarboxylase n=1 Tax=Rickettsiales endosymbiont of Stachyamoeba lipophora TaxID=2486578 RepID=UPI000F646E99|nr:uroporphyrinogen decarboxylase [Rickettsiales endosymbiont of Stachyamoeba lipophora]AZL15605.1 uroporphyrinogen decarboxylase [Rickettsiales endosymbiont of Stachyamoeba lipophora]